MATEKKKKTKLSIPVDIMKAAQVVGEKAQRAAATNTNTGKDIAPKNTTVPGQATLQASAKNKTTKETVSGAVRGAKEASAALNRNPVQQRAKTTAPGQETLQARTVQKRTNSALSQIKTGTQKANAALRTGLGRSAGKQTQTAKSNYAQGRSAGKKISPAQQSTTNHGLSTLQASGAQKRAENALQQIKTGIQQSNDSLRTGLGRSAGKQTITPSKLNSGIGRSAGSKMAANQKTPIPGQSTLQARGEQKKTENSLQQIKTGAQQANSSLRAGFGRSAGKPKVTTFKETVQTMPKTTQNMTDSLGELSQNVRQGQTLNRQAGLKDSDMVQLTRNSLAWHKATTQTEKDALKKQNDEIRKANGLSYSDETGETYDKKTGINLSSPVNIVYGQKPGAQQVSRVIQANNQSMENDAANWQANAEKRSAGKQEEYDKVTEEINTLLQEKPYLGYMQLLNSPKDMAFNTAFNNFGKQRTEQAYNALTPEQREAAQGEYEDYMRLINRQNELEKTDIAYSAKNAGLHVLHPIESAARALIGYGEKGMAALSSLPTGGKANAVSNWWDEGAERALGNSVTANAITQNDQAANIVNPTRKRLEIVNSQLAEMMPTIIASTAMGGLGATTGLAGGASGNALTAAGAAAQEKVAQNAGLALMGLGAAGSATKQALDEGANINQAVSYGIGSGLVEVGTENMFGGIPGLNKGVVSQAIKKLSSNKVIGTVIDTLGEGAEEAVSELADPVLKRMTYDPNATTDINAVVDSAVMGIVLSGVLQAGMGTTARIADKKFGSTSDYMTSWGENEIERAARQAQDIYDTAKDIQTGEQTAQGIQTGAQTAQGIQTGEQTAQGIQTGAQTAQGIQTGAQTAQGIQTGAQTAQGIQTGAQTAQGIQTGAQTAQTEARRAELSNDVLRLTAELKQAKTMLPGNMRDARVMDITGQLDAVGNELQGLDSRAAPKADEDVTAFQNATSDFLNRMDAEEAAKNKAPYTIDEQAQDQMDAWNSDSYQKETLEKFKRNYTDRVRILEGGEGELGEIRQAYIGVKEAEARRQDVEIGLSLTADDRRIVDSAVLSDGMNADFSNADNPEDARLLFEAKMQEKQAYAPIREFNIKQRAAREKTAEMHADAIAKFATDKKLPISYQLDTQERNIKSILGKEHGAEAQAIIDEYFKPVHDAATQKTRLENEMRAPLREYKFTRDESAVIQLIMEGETGGAQQYIADNKMKITPEVQKKIDTAVETLKQNYNTLYDKISDAMIEAGYEPPAFRKNYAPHFQDFRPDTTIGKILYKMGIGSKADAIPTDIAGLTDQFRPNKQWFGNLLQRTGETSVYDAIGGFDRYVDTASNIICFTKSIENLRALEDGIRYRLSDTGTQEKITAIRNDFTLDPAQKRQRMEEVYGQKKGGMGGYVTDLRSYTDTLAGKKNRADRFFEDAAGRQFYQIAKNTESRFSRNATGFNISTALTNFAPIFQSMSEVRPDYIVRGMYDTVKSLAKNDGFVEASDFLTRRKGSEKLYYTPMEKAGNAGYAFMQFVDDIAGSTIVRAKTAQNMKEGMDFDSALSEADEFGARLMADRTQGALPTIFEQKNPISRMITMFQVENMNNLNYMAKDLKGNSDAKGAAAFAGALTRYGIGSFLFNELTTKIMGRRVLIDPLYYILDLFGIGDDDKDKTVPDRISEVGSQIIEDTPFLGSFFGGGRVPISGAIPDFGNLGNAVLPQQLTGNEWSGGKRAETALKELAKPAAYLLMPFGGGQLNKTVQGIATVKAGGSYKTQDDGSRVLQFPSYGNSPLNVAQNAIFGKWSTQEGRDYIENGFKGLSARQTNVYDILTQQGVDNMEAYDIIKAISEKSKTDTKTKKEAQQEALFYTSGLTPAQKEVIDLNIIQNGKEDAEAADYSNSANFKLSTMVSSGQKEAAQKAVNSGVSVEKFMKYADMFKGYQADDEDGPDMSKSAARLQIIKDMEADDTLTNGEKQTIADTLLLDSLSKANKEQWGLYYKGKLDATEFVNLCDTVAQNKEIESLGKNVVSNTWHAANNFLIKFGKSAQKELTEDKPSASQRAATNNAKFIDTLNVDEATKESLKNYYASSSLPYKWDMVKNGSYIDYAEKEAAGLEASGMSIEDYNTYIDKIKSFTSDKDASGKTISGSLKTKVVKYVRGLDGLTQEQQDALILSKYTKTETGAEYSGLESTGQQTAQEDNGGWINPVASGGNVRLSSQFGYRESPTDGASSDHPSIDIAADAGTPVAAAKSGVVTAVNHYGYGSGYGTWVAVDIGDGYVVQYNHMQEGSADGLNVGDTITQGQQVGRVGSTGISTGPHLDFNVKKDGVPVNPLQFIPGY